MIELSPTRALYKPIGRFLSRDFSRNRVANRYSYCADGPPRYVDPLGSDFVEADGERTYIVGPYWRGLRQSIIAMHKANGPRESLDSVVRKTMDVRKRPAYATCIRAYKRWMGRKRVRWIGSPSTLWQSGSVQVRVNPELGLKIDGVDHVVKLYFKAEKPTKRRVETILHLLASTLPRRYRQATPGVLDVQRGRLIVPTVEVADVDALLAGDAAAFEVMFKRV
jgi:hypothetical protein